MIRLQSSERVSTKKFEAAIAKVVLHFYKDLSVLLNVSFSTLSLF